jgi:hypothetical protein
VIGDAKPARVAEQSKTVTWAVEKLEQDWFPARPDHIIDVWLFDGKASYDRWTRELFGDRPSTPYGYYSSEHRALIMNIATGGGTLVHEIVHPYMAANFPDCPSWFNEGLASLYEQSSERDGRIVGLTNWRLAGLQDAIRAGEVPSFRALMSTSDAEFYDDDTGVHYAQARYLLYYLQEQELLDDYWRRWRPNAGKDPTGYATLKAVLGVDDLAAFQREWERWVLGLRFP